MIISSFLGHINVGTSKFSLLQTGALVVVTFGAFGFAPAEILKLIGKFSKDKVDEFTLNSVGNEESLSDHRNLFSVHCLVMQHAQQLCRAGCISNIIAVKACNATNLCCIEAQHMLCN